MTTRLASLPLPRGPWGNTIHRVTHIEIILVEITADNGVTGIRCTSSNS